MKNFLGITSLLVAVSLFAPSSALAQGRAKNKIGLSFAILGDPFPSLKSYQLAYNITPWARVHANYGSISLGAVSLIAYGASAKFFLIPKWNFSPYVGASYSRGSGTGSFTIGSETISVTQSLNTISGSAGFDHQSNIGFNFGAGINYFLSPTIVTDSLTFLGTFHIGWYF